MRNNSVRKLIIQSAVATTKLNETHAFVSFKRGKTHLKPKKHKQADFDA